ncbi:UvrD-helicase domain-containing protein [Paludisphaera sp.]|uniref:UvrD-helicase domain-containing protein n=1 Tax=Paludisphaera sp. TaxID=2017432 RepID=UPI00301C7F39
MSDDRVSLTDEQRGPLEPKGASIALAAGAGCGKTTVLTERFLAEIDGGQGRALRSLAVMTFTDKAARELRERIRHRCRARLAAGSDPAWWAIVLRALEAAPIGTFHEFCGRALRGRAVELGVDPEFAVLDDVVAGALREQAAGAAIRRLLAQVDPDITSLALPHTLRVVRRMLEKVLASRTADEIEPLCDLEPPQIVARWEEAWSRRARPATLARLGPSLRACRRVLAPLLDVGPKLASLRAEVLMAMDDVEARGRDADLDNLHKVARITSIRGKNDWPDADVKERVKAAFETVRKDVEKVRGRLAWDEAVTLESAAETARFARVARAAREEYDRLKARRRGLDFADLIVLTRDAFRDLAAPIGEPDEDPAEVEPTSIDFVLVDEFQDTDEVQSDVLRLLARDGFRDGRMFVVGDAKQSIYRFRGAEPAIFGRWREEFHEHGRLRLSENFRTVPRVIDFVNALFADSFAEPGAAPDPAAVRLAPRRLDHAEGPAVHFFWVPPDEPEGDEKPAKPTAQECRVREADALARWLRHRLDAGWTIVDRGTRRPRPAHAGDVAVLLRAMTDVWPYEQALADQGFEYHTIGGSAFYSRQEILDVVNLLSVVEDPLDDVALAGCLRGPFFALSDEALFWLSRAGGLARGLEAAAGVDGLSDRDRDLAARARDMLDRLRAMKDRVPMAELLSRAVDETGFAAALTCEFLGERKLANVRKLIETAREFDRRGGFGLADFVGRLRAFADDPPREEQAATTDEDSPSVRIMTVHQAKGLEFPIVILPDLDRDTGPKTDPMGFDRELGLVLKPRPAPAEPDDRPGAGESLGWRAFQAIDEREEREEALRLFYVAATRARDDLVLSSAFATPLPEVAASVAKLSPALNLLWERFDGLTGRCTADLPEGWPCPEGDVVDVAAIPASEKRVDQRRRPRLPEIVAAIEAEPLEGRPPVLPPAAPRLLDLEAPLREETRTARLAALIRASAFDAELIAGADPEKVTRRLAARQTPAAGASLRADAVAWLRAWVAGDFFAALRRSREIRPGEPWTLPGAPAVLGSCDALALAEDGRWRVVSILAPGESPAWGRLRASLAPAALDLAPMGPSWLVRVDADGALIAERRKPIPDDERDRLAREMAGA